MLAFPTPIDDESQLKKLDDMEQEELKEEFTDLLDVLKFKIFEDAPCKKVYSKNING